MRTEPNRKLSKHFSLYEFIEGTTMPKAGHEMNWKYFSECDQDSLELLAYHLEVVRKWTNDNFKLKNKGRTIGLAVTSGFRCLFWERLRGRSGLGQHPYAKAADVIPTNVPKELSDEIIKWWDKIYSPREGGWNGGFAILNPTSTTSGFGHFDIRGTVARWTY